MLLAQQAETPGAKPTRSVQSPSPIQWGLSKPCRLSSDPQVCAVLRVHTHYVTNLKIINPYKKAGRLKQCFGTCHTRSNHELLQPWVIRACPVIKGVHHQHPAAIFFFFLRQVIHSLGLAVLELLK